VPNLDLLLGLLLAVVVFTTLAQRLRIAYPVLLVLGGLVLSFVPGLPAINLSPNLVLLLFLPPSSTGSRSISPIATCAPICTPS